MAEKFYITTAIAYSSGKPHFGNTYEVIMTDAVARYHRAKGDDVYFCTATSDKIRKPMENTESEMPTEPCAPITFA